MFLRCVLELFHNGVKAFEWHSIALLVSWKSRQHTLNLKTHHFPVKAVFIGFILQWSALILAKMATFASFMNTAYTPDRTCLQTCEGPLFSSFSFRCHFDSWLTDISEITTKCFSSTLNHWRERTSSHFVDGFHLTQLLALLSNFCGTLKQLVTFLTTSHTLWSLSFILSIDFTLIKAYGRNLF